MKTVYLVCRSGAEAARELVSAVNRLFPECEVHVIHDPAPRPATEPESSPALS